MAVRVFVSYSSHDRAEALAVRRILEDAGCEVWLDVFDIRPTGHLDSELTEALERADLVCVLLSPTSVVSPWVRRELATALAGTARGQRLLPVILRPCELPPELGDLVGIDAQDGAEAEHVRLRLRRAVLGGTAVPDPVLDEAYRRMLADRAQMLAATESTPKVMDELAGVWRTPIRQIQISVNPRAIPEESMLELRFSLEHDNLFTAPACFFFAHLREGRTWPPEARFEEPPPETSASDRRGWTRRCAGSTGWSRWARPSTRPGSGTIRRRSGLSSTVRTGGRAGSTCGARTSSRRSPSSWPTGRPSP